MAITPSKNDESCNVLLLPIIVFMLCIISINANAHTSYKMADTIIYKYSEVDKKPEFPGGNDKIMVFVDQNFKYPPSIWNKKIQAELLIQFIITKSGKITDVIVINREDVGSELSEEAVRVIKDMPKWKPGKMNGKPVDVSFTMSLVCDKLSRKEQDAAFAKAYKERTGKDITFTYSDWTENSEFEGKNDSSSVFVEEMPEFPGGNDKIMAFIYKKFFYPPQAVRKKIEGMLLVQFTITESGEVANVKVVRGQELGRRLAEEAVRVVESMPRWKPGTTDGKPVKVAYTLPIVLKLRKELNSPPFVVTPLWE